MAGRRDGFGQTRAGHGRTSEDSERKRVFSMTIHRQRSISPFLAVDHSVAGDQPFVGIVADSLVVREAPGVHGCET